MAIVARRMTALFHLYPYAFRVGGRYPRNKCPHGPQAAQMLTDSHQRLRRVASLRSAHQPLPSTQKMLCIPPGALLCHGLLFARVSLLVRTEGNIAGPDLSLAEKACFELNTNGGEQANMERHVLCVGGRLHTARPTRT